MFHNKLFKSIAVTTAVFGLSLITPISSTITNTTTETQTAHADTILPDGPWEPNSDGSDFTQKLYNGNEIYYAIAPNDKYTKYFQQAVADWNALGVIKLVQVNWGDPNSGINMQYNDGKAPKYTMGETKFDSNDTNVWANITIYKLSDRNNSVTKQVICDHELGHALGFAHDQRKPNNGKQYKKLHLTMYKYTYDGLKFYQLGGIEQRSLADHYHIQPSNGYLNTNY